MPLDGFKSVTVPEEAYSKAKQLITLGLEESLGKAFYNAISEYVEKRKALIDELRSVRKKWSEKNP